MKKQIYKGRLFVPSWNVEKVFLLNPSQFTDNQEATWGSAQIPGASCPVYGFGSGGERTIEFTLHIEPPRHLLVKNMTPMEVKFAEHTSPHLDITEEIMWYRRLLAPSLYGGTISDVAPPLVQFTYGFWKSVPCFVKKANVTLSQFNTAGYPMVGDIAMGLVENCDQVVQTYDDPAIAKAPSWFSARRDR